MKKIIKPALLILVTIFSSYSRVTRLSSLPPDDNLVIRVIKESILLALYAAVIDLIVTKVKFKK